MQAQPPAPPVLETAHTVPLGLALADTVLALGYLSLSSRQLVLLLLGGSLAVSLWTRTAILAAVVPPVGAALHSGLLVLSSLIILALTFGQAAGRPLDAWVIVWLSYRARPRRYRWRSLRDLGEPRKDEPA